MIDEAIGKILGMAMAYGVSAVGMFVAYVNYRRRVVKADTVMTPAAWVVIAVSALAVVGAVVVVVQLATVPTSTGGVKAAVEEVPVESPTAARSGEARKGGDWPWVGIVIPAGIFLFATLVTAALHRHFTTHGP